jgi:hypothetical protein
LPDRYSAPILSRMWREYTREVPARPGLALVATLLCLIGTICLARVVVDRRQAPQKPVQIVRHSQWPVTFELPGRFEPVTNQGLRFQDFSGLLDHVLVFTDHKASELILVSYEIRDPGTSAGELLEQDSGRASPMEPIDMGIAEGRFLAKVEKEFGPVYLAAGCTPEGLAVFVQYVTSAPEFRAVQSLRDACKTISWQPWSLRP